MITGALTMAPDSISTPADVDVPAYHHQLLPMIVGHLVRPHRSVRFSQTLNPPLPVSP